MNNNGQLGDGTRRERRAPVAVRGLSAGVVEIAAGDYFTCARLESGTVKCWGSNRLGELGNGKSDDSLVPVAVVGLNRKR
jgi:alpha-tubulin suppressor-like RCC1 family protein